MGTRTVTRRPRGAALLLLVTASFLSQNAQGADTLHSWNSGPTKFAVIQFVRDVTDEGGPNFVPPAERIAVFSHDGTLFPEQPAPVELAFLMDRIKTLASTHPRWNTKEPFKSALSKNLKALASFGTKGILELTASAHTGMTMEEFDGKVTSWMTKARNRRLFRPYSQCALLPMLELLDFLRSSGFKIYIIQRGDVAFLRSWAGKVYGVPPEQIIGSSVRMKYEVHRGVPRLVRKGAFDMMEDGPGRPAAVYRAIGRRPIAAFGSSDADLEMLQWTAGGQGRHLVLLVHHTNGGNEFSYDRKALFGRLDKALDVARKSGWTIADMTKDWNRFFLKTEK
jgi:hypothetical protein